MGHGRRCAVASIVAVLVLGVAATGASATPSKKDLTGTWSGTWERTSAPPTQGTMTVTLKQKGSKVSGQETVVGSACLTTNAVAGKLHGTSITFAVSQPSINAAYSGRVSGKTMSGTLKVTCGTATGTGDFSLKRK